MVTIVAETVQTGIVVEAKVTVSTRAGTG